MRHRTVLAALGVLVAVTLSACGGERADQASIATTSNEQVQVIAENLLAAYNLGDYQAFSRDLSLPAKPIVDEEAFAKYRYENLPATGPFMAITSVQREPGEQDPDHVRYRVQARFHYVSIVALVITLSPTDRSRG